MIKSKGLPTISYLSVSLPEILHFGPTLLRGEVEVSLLQFPWDLILNVFVALYIVELLLDVVLSPDRQKGFGRISYPAWHPPSNRRSKFTSLHLTTHGYCHMTYPWIHLNSVQTTYGSGLTSIQFGTELGLTELSVKWINAHSKTIWCVMWKGLKTLSKPNQFTL
jgi:hypothetical protein